MLRRRNDQGFALLEIALVASLVASAGVGVVEWVAAARSFDVVQSSADTTATSVIDAIDRGTWCDTVDDVRHGIEASGMQFDGMTVTGTAGREVLASATPEDCRSPEGPLPPGDLVVEVDATHRSVTGIVPFGASFVVSGSAAVGGGT